MQIKKIMGIDTTITAIMRKARTRARTQKRAVAAQPEDAIYTCPMHPQVRQRPRELPDLRHWRWSRKSRLTKQEPSPELADMRRRFWISLVLAMPVLILEMGGHLVDLHMRPHAANVELAAARPCHAGGPVGWLAVLRKGVAVHHRAAPEHVHADRHGHGSCLGLQCRCDSSAGPVPATYRSTAERLRSISKRLP